MLNTIEKYDTEAKNESTWSLLVVRGLMPRLNSALAVIGQEIVLLGGNTNNTSTSTVLVFDTVSEQLRRTAFSNSIDIDPKTYPSAHVGNGLVVTVDAVTRSLIEYDHRNSQIRIATQLN